MYRTKSNEQGASVQLSLKLSGFLFCMGILTTDKFLDLVDDSTYEAF